VLDGDPELTKREHKYQTLVIDTLDWLEPMIWRPRLRARRQGQHRGVRLRQGIRRGARRVARVRRGARAAAPREGMHVVLLAHSLVKTFKNPEGEDYDRYSLALHDKAGGLLKQWARPSCSRTTRPTS
jgi:hypothetical protein